MLQTNICYYFLWSFWKEYYKGCQAKLQKAIYWYTKLQKTQKQLMQRNYTGLGHADTAVDDGERVVGIVWDDVDEELRLGILLALVSETLKTNLI